MSIITYDAVDEIINLIKTKWSDIRPPRVSAIWDKRTVGFIDDRRDELLLYPKNENIEYFGLYGVDHMSEVDITIEIRTFMNHDHHNNIVKEVAKIVKDNIRRPDFVDLMVINTVSGNDPYRNMFKHSIGLRYRKMNPS